MITCTFEKGYKATLRHAVVDGLVLKDDKILLVKRSEKIIEGGKWGVVGGFAGRDETLTEAMKREIFEETGYRVSKVTLLAINDKPDRPHEDRQNISFIFFCEAGKQEGESDWEVTDKKWFPLENLPDKDVIAFDHYDAIRLYLKWKEHTKPLPILVSQINE